MGENKQTFFEKTKRFFEPISQNKVVFGKGFFVSFLWGINAIVHVLFLERILYYLESGFQETFTVILGYYLFYILGYEIINFSVKKWGWVEAMPRTWITLCENYLKKYILLDNNRVEIEGTGKMISIIYGGIRQWGFLLWNSIELGLKVLVSMLFGFYMLTNINDYYAWLFFILFTVFFLISVYFSTQLQPYRRKRNDNMNIISKQITKVLMGKNE
ncbi:hypothetical protein MK079_05115, partial [Candidatus Gracilibacteria bacterium]|nr:hypothetical protein [Candidatus Gracilibacteria bacterium]